MTADNAAPEAARLDLGELRRKHREVTLYGLRACAVDDEIGPCTVVRLLDELQQTEERAERLRVALRAVADWLDENDGYEHFEHDPSSGSRYSVADVVADDFPREAVRAALSPEASHE